MYLVTSYKFEVIIITLIIQVETFQVLEDESNQGLLVICYNICLGYL